MNNIFAVLLLFLGLSWTIQSEASVLKSDTSAFEQQRLKVNLLLEERDLKFSEYEISLEQRTGIFGLFKSTKDLQRSNDILQSIIINDNKILLETRKLLDLKDSERERFQRLATEYDSQVTAYMKTISKLQKENEKLRDNINTLNSQGKNYNKLLYISLIIFSAMAFVIFKLYKRGNTNILTKV